LKQYQGFKLEVARKDQADHSAPDDQIALLAGHTFDRGSTLFAISHRDRERILQRDYPRYVRAISQANNLASPGAFPGAFYQPVRNQATGVLAATPIVRNAANTRADPGCAHTFQNPGNDPTLDNGFRWGLRGTTATNSNDCFTHLSEYADYQPDLQHLHSFARVEYQLTDGITAAFDVIWGRQEFNTRVPPTSAQAPRAGLQVSGDLAGNPFVAFVDRNAAGTAGVIDANEKLVAQDTCNFVNCSAGDGFPDRDFDGDGIADPAAQGRYGVPQLLLSATNDADGDGTPDRFDPDRAVAGVGTFFSEDVEIKGWTPFGKNLQGLPAGLLSDGSAIRRRDSDSVRFSGNVNVEIPDTSWEVDLTGISGRRTTESALNIGNITNISFPAAQVAFSCVNPADITAGRCIPFNPFSTSQFTVVDRVPQNTVTPATDPAFNTRDEANSLFVYNEDLTIEKITVVDLVGTGELFDIPAGPVQIAAGVNYRDEEFENDVNPLNATATQVYGSNITPLRGSLQSLDYFAELSVPLLDGSWAGTAELQLAARRTTNDAGATIGLVSDTAFDDTVLKVAALWQVTDWVSLRASWGEGFVVPEISQLFTSERIATRGNVLDPLCEAVRQFVMVQLGAESCEYAGTSLTPNRLSDVTERLRGNPELLPESSEVVNVGFTLSLLEGDLSLQADWIEVDYEDVIFNFNITSNLAFEQIRFAELLQSRNCTAATNPATCAEQARTDYIRSGQSARITRDDATAGAGLGRLRAVQSENVNILARQVKSADFQAIYRFDAADIPLIGADFGDFTLRLGGTYMRDYVLQLNPADAAFSGVGNRNDGTAGIAPLPRWKAQGALSWTHGAHFARLTARYHHHVDDLTATGGINANANTRGRIPSATYWDLFYSYRWEGLLGDDTTTISLGVQNLFDHLPRPIEDHGGLDSNLDNPFGTMWTLRLAHEM
jgi:hypothetical protein